MEKLTTRSARRLLFRMSPHSDGCCRLELFGKMMIRRARRSGEHLLHDAGLNRGVKPSAGQRRQEYCRSSRSRLRGGCRIAVICRTRGGLVGIRRCRRHFLIVLWRHTVISVLRLAATVAVVSGCAAGRGRTMTSGTATAAAAAGFGNVCHGQCDHNGEHEHAESTHHLLLKMRCKTARRITRRS